MEASARRWGALAAFGLLSTLARAVSAAEPCKLLTLQEIGQVLGASVSPPTPLGTTGCLWSGSAQRVSIVLRPATAWARITMPGPGITKTNVSGLGEAASFSGMDNQKFLTLSVKQGANVIVLTASGVNGTERQRSAEESLARLALPRL
jgi:hypothetical protein